MPQTANCPRCQQAITIPAVPTENAVVQCPLCQERFDLSEALDFVAETESEPLPPELIIISAGSEEGGGAAETSTESGEPASGGESSEDGPNEVRCPCCRRAFRLETLLLAETDEPLGQEAAARILGRAGSAEPAAEGGMRFDFGSSADRGDHTDFRLQLGGGERLPEPAGAFQFGAPIGAGGQSGAGEARGAAARPRPRRNRGGLKDLIGAILGGAAGLLITYYMLNLIGGRRFDFLQVYLPGVRHTAAHRPDWLGGPPEESEEAADPELDDRKAVERRPSVGGGSPPKVAGDGGQAHPPVAVEESAPQDVAESATEASPPDSIGLVNPPEVTPDLFGTALKAVAEAMKPGNLNEEGYAAWCRLAEAATFVDRRGGGPQMQYRFDAVRRLLRDLDAEDFARIGQWAGHRLADSGRTSDGILLVGTAANPNTPRGKGYMSTLQVAGTGERVVVVSSSILPIAQDDRLLLLGQIVDHPKEALRGLDTELPQVIWSGMVLKSLSPTAEKTEK